MIYILIFKEIHSRMYNPRLVLICPKFCNMSYRPIILYSGYIKIYFSQENFSQNGPILTFEAHHTQLSNPPNFQTLKKESILSQTVMKISWCKNDGFSET